MESDLIVDQPKPGFNSLNHDNTARIFFENPSILAAMTWVDEDLIKSFHMVLQTISSGNEIHFIKFQDYALQTARYFVQLHPWFYMPTSLQDSWRRSDTFIGIVDRADVTQEATNKYIK